MVEIGIDGICIICGNLTKDIRNNSYICSIHKKAFWDGYWCVSPYWKTCQLDCGDCNMLRGHKKNCPWCNSTNLSYGKGDANHKLDSYYSEFICLDCRRSGRFWYDNNDKYIKTVKDYGKGKQNQNR